MYILGTSPVFRHKYSRTTKKMKTYIAGVTLKEFGDALAEFHLFRDYTFSKLLHNLLLR